LREQANHIRLVKAKLIGRRSRFKGSGTHAQSDDYGDCV